MDVSATRVSTGLTAVKQFHVRIVLDVVTLVLTDVLTTEFVVHYLMKIIFHLQQDLNALAPRVSKELTARQ